MVGSYSLVHLLRTRRSEMEDLPSERQKYDISNSTGRKVAAINPRHRRRKGSATQCYGRALNLPVPPSPHTVIEIFSIGSDDMKLRRASILESRVSICSGLFIVQ